jgi:glycosyltransferase involved in cell wall biosynthesis
MPFHLPRLRIRRRFRNMYYRLQNALLVPTTKPASGTPVVVGLLRAPIGIGESARLCLAALQELGYSVQHFDVTGLRRRKDEISLEVTANGTASFEDQGPLLLHLNAPQMPRVLATLGRRRVGGRLLIGYWHWELPGMPRAWSRMATKLHEIWVPSEFCASAVSAQTSKPVRVVPHPVRPYAGPPWDRRQIGLSERHVVVLCIYDMGSSQARKNPVGAVRAFRRAFGDREDTVLVVKVRDPGASRAAFDALKAEIGGARNIRLLAESLTGDEMASLVAGGDIVLSLHRSEGFGLIPAQAMLAGKPVVATGWSGNMQFMDSESAALVPYRLVPVHDPQGIYPAGGQLWAEPDLEAAAEWLRRLAEDRELRRGLGARGRSKATQSLSLEAYAQNLGPAFHAAVRRAACRSSQSSLK